MPRLFPLSPARTQHLMRCLQLSSNGDFSMKVKTSGNRCIAQKQKILTLNLLCDLGNVATERYVAHIVVYML